MSTAANTTTSATNPTATPSTSRPTTVPAGMPVANVVDLNALVAALGQLRGHGTSDRLLQLKELPTFSGSPGEDANEFMQRFERCGYAHGWEDADKLKHFYLAVTKNAMQWHESNPGATWAQLKRGFLAICGRKHVDFDIMAVI